MRPVRLTYAPADADLTRYLSNATGATWTLTETATTDSLAHTVTIQNDTATDHSVKTALLTGTDFAGRVLTEIINLPGANLTVATTRYFKTLTSIVPSATIGADTMDIGQGAGFMSFLIGTNWRGGETSVNLDITGEMDVTVQQTFDDIQDPVDFDYFWQDAPIAKLVNATASTNAVYVGVPTAIRLIGNSSTAPASVVISVVSRDI